MPKSSLTSLSAQAAALKSFSKLTSFICWPKADLAVKFSYGVKKTSQVEKLGTL